MSDGSFTNSAAHGSASSHTLLARPSVTVQWKCWVVKCLRQALSSRHYIQHMLCLFSPTNANRPASPIVLTPLAPPVPSSQCHLPRHSQRPNATRPASPNANRPASPFLLDLINRICGEAKITNSADRKLLCVRACDLDISAILNKVIQKAFHQQQPD